MKKILDFFSLKNASYLTDEIIEQSRLFPKYNNRKIDDEFLGEYQDKDICISECKLISHNE